MKAVTTRAPWAAVLLLLLQPPDPLTAASCREFNALELPRTWGSDGTWLSSSRLALTDFDRNRFLVYGTDGDEVQSVDPSAEGPDALRTLDITSVRDGFVMAALYRDEARYSEGIFFLRLGSNLKPVAKYSWPREWGDDVHHRRGSLGRPLVTNEVVGTENGLIAWLDFADPERDGIMQFGLPTENGPSVLTLTGSWHEMPTEVHPQVPVIPSHLTATTGDNAAAYALRIDDKPFIQRLAGRGERLEVFPEWPGPMPRLPPLASAAQRAPWWKAVENASFPAGLYAEGPHLYVLVRLAATDGPEWELHAIDPVAESLLHGVRLPTRAAHVSLVPGPTYWALIEGSSYSEDSRRKPKRLLLLNARAIRSGEALSCN